MDDQERRDGTKALEALPWVSKLKGGGVIARIFTQGNAYMEKHYVVGSRAPFLFRAGTQKMKGNRHATAVWAVYAGKYAANASNMVQGGAVAAMFDFITACYGSMLYPKEGGAFGMTKRLSVRYLRPVQPVPGVFKIVVDCTSIDEEKGELKVQASLFPPTSPFRGGGGGRKGGGRGAGRGGGAGDGGGSGDKKGENNKEKPFAVAEAELIDLRRRKRWKAAYRNKTAAKL